MPNLKRALMCSALFISAMAEAADDEVYSLPLKSIAVICQVGEDQAIPNDKFNEYFNDAIPILRSIKENGGLVGASYLTDIRSGVLLAFQDSKEHTAIEYADRFKSEMQDTFDKNDIDINLDDVCERFEVGGQMM